MIHEAEQIATGEACRNCGVTLHGHFCHECGERRPQPHEWSIGHLLHDVVHELTHLDGKIFRTLWLLLRRPGFLTAEYWAGRRTGYIRPMRLYLVIATLHLLAMSATVYRVDFFKAVDNAGQLTRMMEKRAAARQVPVAAIEAEINSKIVKTYSVAQYFAVLAFAAVPLALYRRRQPHYVAHLIYALHTYSFYFALSSVIGLLLSARDWQRTPIGPIVSLLYLYFSVRRLYGEKWYVAAFKAVLLRLGLFLTELLVLAVSLWTAILLASAH